MPCGIIHSTIDQLLRLISAKEGADGVLVSVRLLAIECLLRTTSHQALKADLKESLCNDIVPTHLTVSSDALRFLAIDRGFYHQDDGRL
ncbi:hypothetical protein KCU61_g646, partial [Aureobasidium melanogenum]